MLHAFRPRGFHGIEQCLVFALAMFNTVAGAGVGLENFNHGHASAAVRLGYKTLADDVTKRFGEAMPYRLLLRGTERSYYPLHRFRRVHSVQAGKHQMTG